MKQRIIKEKVKKAFLLDLLEPFHPTLKNNEKIIDLEIRPEPHGGFQMTYIVKEV